MVLVVVDSLRADHLAHLGYERPTSVGLDPFRDESVLFAEGWATAPATLPSVASLLTGRLPPAHGLGRPDDVLSESVPTLAAHLRRHGYTTAALAHHPGSPPERGLDRGFDRFERGDRAGDAAAFLPWLREWLASEPRAPFFLYLHATNVHAPYRVPPSERAALLGRPPSTAFGYAEARSRGLLRRRGRVPPGQAEALVEQYDSALRYTLDRIAEAFGMLRRHGLWDESLVVLTADHGEELFDHGRLGHGLTLHREVMRVPIYVKPPGGAPPRLVRAPVSGIDVAPTILDLAGVPPMPAADGASPARSLASAVRGEGEPAAVAIFHHAAFATGGVARAVREGRWMLVERFAPDGVSRELYDVAIDPGERQDRIVQGAEIAARLAGRLAETFGPVPDVRAEGQ